MATKINIKKDTIDIKEATNLPKMLLFVLSKFSDVNLRTAYFIAQNKVKEISYFHKSYLGE